MNKAKVTISRRSNMKGNGKIYIDIKDASSSIKICEVSMEYADFAECITGMSMSDADVEWYPTEYGVQRYGKKLEVKTVIIDLEEGQHSLPKDTPDEFFYQHIPEGWELNYMGLSSQQPHKKHNFSICRYVDSKECEE